VRIALACPYAWEDAGGVQVHIRELAVRLRERGHDVIVVTPARGPVADPHVVRVGTPVDIPYNASNAPIDPRPWSRRRIREVLGAFRPDVVHAHQPTAPSTGMWATLEARAPVVGTFHSGAGRARLYDLTSPVIRRVARRLAVRIAVSRRAAAFERARIGGVFEIIPNGVDVSRFSSARPADLPDGRRLLFVGRLDERKGFAVAVEAFARLADATDGGDLRLIVVGDGPERDAVERLPDGPRARVTMLGTLPNEALPAVEAACHVYVGPVTGGESFGVVLIEAMAAGLPIVASDTPGYDEVVRDGVDGLLVPPSDPDAVAVAAGRILDDAGLAASLAAAGRDRAEDFDWPVVVDRIEAIYRRVLQPGSASLR